MHCEICTPEFTELPARHVSEAVLMYRKLTAMCILVYTVPYSCNYCIIWLLLLASWRAQCTVKYCTAVTRHDHARPAAAARYTVLYEFIANPGLVALRRFTTRLGRLCVHCAAAVSYVSAARAKAFPSYSVWPSRSNSFILLVTSSFPRDPSAASALHDHGGGAGDTRTAAVRRAAALVAAVQHAELVLRW